VEPELNTATDPTTLIMILIFTTKNPQIGLTETLYHIYYSHLHQFNYIEQESKTDSTVFQTF
jgi:hypothetical protein